MAAKSSKGKKGTQRKLTAILSADVVGYSRLMGADEESTIETLTAYRKVFLSQIVSHSGRVVDAKGDAILAEFASVVDAVNSSVEIQRELAERNAELPDDRRMDFRIGVNLGDVVVKDDVIYGDGVNVAARLETLADGGGICISRSAYDQVRNKLKLEFEFLGKKEVKNIEDPVPVYRVLSTPGAAAHRVVRAKRALAGKWRKAVLAAIVLAVLAGGGLLGWNYYHQRSAEGALAAFEKEAALPLPDKPSIAVLAFNNLSGDKEQEYFSDGISENIITDLSKLSGLFVIARNSSFKYKGKQVDIRQVGQELGVRYVLEGSVQRAGERVRVTAQLIDAATGKHIWAERYDRRLQDIFALQDELTEKIVDALEVELTMDEVTRIQRKSTDNVEAWDHYLKGRKFFLGGRRIENYFARDEYEKALELDPDFVAATLGLGWTFLFQGGQVFGRKELLDTVEEIARGVISRNDKLAEPYALLNGVFMFRNQFDQAIAYGKRAVELNPNGADWHAQLARTLSLVGKTEEALVEIKKAIRLNPTLQKGPQFTLGRIYYQTAQYEKAVSLFRPLAEQYPGFHTPNFFLVASLAASGRLKQARAAAEKVKGLPLGRVPKSWVRRWSFAFKNKRDNDRLLKDLAKAGLEE